MTMIKPHRWSTKGKCPRRLSVEELEPRTLLSAVSSSAYSLLSDRVQANQASFYVYQDGDSGLNHGFASGKFASNNDPTLINGLAVNPSYIDDPDGFDEVLGTVLRIAFPSVSPGEFVGLNIEEPETFGSSPRGRGYDLRGVTHLVFEARSPTIEITNMQFGVGGKVTDRNAFFRLSDRFATFRIPVSTLRDPASNAVSPPDLTNVHVLFTITGSDFSLSSGGTILLDNIRFEPNPVSHSSQPSLPLGTQTFGVAPVVTPPVNQPIPPDQANRNLASVYESSLTILNLLDRGAARDLVNARAVADSLVYALKNDVKGDGLPGHGAPIPTAPDGSVGLHSGYSSGDLAHFNDQLPDQGKQGQTRLAGFTGPNGYFLVLDGATGGNNAFAILALTASFRRFGDVRYLDAAREIGRWIASNLADATGTGFGGYYNGYRDRTFPKQLELGKSVENNADIFAAFTELATTEAGLGNPSAAAIWTTRANAAGDFVMAMYDAAMKRFNAGTVPLGTVPSAGIAPTGPQQGNDIINRFDFLDSNSFATLALAPAPRYRNMIDWRDPVQFLVNRFKQSISVGGQVFQGFSLVAQPTTTPSDNRSTPGPNGIAWEFTGQAIVAMRFVDALYGDSRFEATGDFYISQLERAQTSAPFADGRGLVAATLQNGDQLLPLDQCLTTPFQCIPERVGLAATTWAILADSARNPLAPRFKAPLIPDATDTFVLGLYSDFLGRSAGAGELLGWRQPLVTAGATPVIGGIIRSHESFVRLVDSFYTYFLERQPNAGEAARWVDRLERRVLNVEETMVSFLTSLEFKDNHPGDDPYIRTLGNLLLCRTLTNSEVGAFRNLVVTIGHAGLVARIVVSADFRSVVVRTLYGSRPVSAMPCVPFVPDLLQRGAAPSAAEVAGWVNTSLDLLGLEASIASSLEYFRQGIPQASPRFLESLYRNALLRTPLAGELDYWTRSFLASGSTRAVMDIERSLEARRRLVQGWYARFLGRPAVNNEEVGFANRLAFGGTEEDVLSEILATDEFVLRSRRLVLPGTENEQYVQALYRFLLERTASSAEVAGWLGTLSGLRGRQVLAQAFLSSAEYRSILVRGYYIGLLRRTPQDSEVSLWVSSPFHATTIRVGIESSPEFSLNG